MKPIFGIISPVNLEIVNSKEREQFVSKRLIVKIGSSTIVKDGDPLNRDFMDNMARQISGLFRSGVEVVIVSSGAVACGRKILGDIGTTTLDNQVAAVYGQPELIAQWKASFSRYGVHVGQELLTDEHLNNNRKVLEDSLKRGVVIINANDPVNDLEMKQFRISADNDRLAGDVAGSIDADTLILLTDVDGVLNKKGELLTHVDRLEDVEDIIKDSGAGTGGMWSKCLVAKQAARDGRRSIIANGRSEDVILRAARGQNVGTRFIPGYMFY